MNFIEALIRLRDDLRNWVAVNLKRRVDKVEGKVLSSNDFTDSEKEKLKGIEQGAIKYVHPSYVSKEAGLYLVSIDETGHVSSARKASKSDIAELGIPYQMITYTLKKSGNKIILEGSDGSSSFVYDEASTNTPTPDEPMTPTKLGTPSIYLETDAVGPSEPTKLTTPSIYLETE